jgi:hypothetical protein
LIVLVDLSFKLYLPACRRSFFATAELKLFSTVLRGRAVDLFFNSGLAAGGILAARQPESGDVGRLNLFNLGGSVAFELRLCMPRVAERWQLTSQHVADRLPDTGFG